MKTIKEIRQARNPKPFTNHKKGKGGKKMMFDILCIQRCKKTNKVVNVYSYEMRLTERKGKKFIKRQEKWDKEMLYNTHTEYKLILVG